MRLFDAIKCPPWTQWTFVIYCEKNAYEFRQCVYVCACVSTLFCVLSPVEAAVAFQLMHLAISGDNSGLSGTEVASANHSYSS